MQIQEKFKIFKRGSVVLDLGAAPGGWSQVAAKLVCSSASEELVLAIDLLPIDDLVGVRIIQGDFLNKEIRQKITSILQTKADVIMSDMAPNTTGERTTDHLRIVALCEQAFEFAQEHLNLGGSFIAKMFQGGTEHNLLKLIKSKFEIVKHFKPDASRKSSSEVYLIATGFRS